MISKSRYWVSLFSLFHSIILASVNSSVEFESQMSTMTSTEDFVNLSSLETGINEHITAASLSSNSTSNFTSDHGPLNKTSTEDLKLTAAIDSNQTLALAESPVLDDAIGSDIVVDSGAGFGTSGNEAINSFASEQSPSGDDNSNSETEEMSPQLRMASNVPPDETLQPPENLVDTSERIVNQKPIQQQVKRVSSIKLDQDSLVKQSSQTVDKNDSNQVPQEESVISPDHAASNADPAASAQESPQTNENGNTSSSNPGIIVGSLLGVIIFIIGSIAFYRSSSVKQLEDHRNDSPKDNLDLRYSIETALQSKTDSGYSFGSAPNQLPVSESTLIENSVASNRASEVSQFDVSSSNAKSTFGTFEGTQTFSVTPEERIEIFDIARSAQNAALTSGYFTKKYATHDSVVSFDSFAG